MGDLLRLPADFERCWKFLEPANERNQTHTKAQVLARIASGRAILFRGDACALVGEIISHPNGLKSGNTWLAGGDLEEIKRIVPQMEEFARNYGCYRAVMLSGRDGWLRVFPGYEKIGIRMAKVFQP